MKIFHVLSQGEWLDVTDRNPREVQHGILEYTFIDEIKPDGYFAYDEQKPSFTKRIIMVRPGHWRVFECDKQVALSAFGDL